MKETIIDNQDDNFFTLYILWKYGHKRNRNKEGTGAKNIYANHQTTENEINESETRTN